VTNQLISNIQNEGFNMKDLPRFTTLFPVVPFAAAAMARSSKWREHSRSQSYAQNSRVTVAPSPFVAAVIARSQNWRANANRSLVK
jgi:hypothetical protein